MYDVATIQTAMNHYVRRVIDAPRTGDAVLLDYCPAGTKAVHSFHSAADAAAFMGVSLSTVYRQKREIDAAIEAEWQWDQDEDTA